MNDSRERAGMSTIVKTVCGWIKGFVLMYGIHVILYGHLTPGGGFAGGVIAAAAFVLVLLAEGEQSALESFSRKAASTWDSVGVLIFLAVAVSGMVLAGMFFVNYWTTPESARLTLFSSGIILPSNIGIGLNVCASLYLVLLVSTAQRTCRSPSSVEEDAS